MKSHFITAHIIAIAAAAPISAPSPASTPLSRVYIRLIGAPNHYDSGSTQKPSTPVGKTIDLPLGVSFDLEEWVTEIEISRINAGLSLSRTSIDPDDTHVVCRTSLNHSSYGPEFTISDMQVRLNGGEPGLLTRLECDKRSV